jgi:hypothetical protein
MENITKVILVDLLPRRRGASVAKKGKALNINSGAPDFPLQPLKSIMEGAIDHRIETRHLP